jgi:hypothetical protein
VVTDRSDSACVLLGMAELHVVAVSEEDGELHVLAETEIRPVGCPTCGTRAESKGRINARPFPPLGSVAPVEHLARRPVSCAGAGVEMSPRDEVRVGVLR